MLAQLEDWAQDDAVLAVSIQGAGERGLCAGNDVRALREGLMQGHGSARVFRDSHAVLSGTWVFTLLAALLRLVEPTGAETPSPRCA